MRVSDYHFLTYTTRGEMLLQNWKNMVQKHSLFSFRDPLRDRGCEVCLSEIPLDKLGVLRDHIRSG